MGRKKKRIEMFGSFTEPFICEVKRSNLTLLTPLFKDSDEPTKVGGTFTGARPDALPAATSDSYGYKRELNPGSLGSSPSQLLSKYCE